MHGAGPPQSETRLNRVNTWIAMIDELRATPENDAFVPAAMPATWVP